MYLSRINYTESCITFIIILQWNPDNLNPDTRDFSIIQTFCSSPSRNMINHLT